MVNIYAQCDNYPYHTPCITLVHSELFSKFRRCQRHFIWKVKTSWISNPDKYLIRKQTQFLAD